ncbi:hypothetical protein [Bradyrhizobium sp. ARR65]|uniref:hypothetical protein n=1 Tax=Bradyrhizobium sp. ARR65 TaxID=1040989 RepID=UPI000ADDCDE1|nr:hypothetical protein [Bradyrhizobium sp. ARR65]
MARVHQPAWQSGDSLARKTDFPSDRFYTAKTQTGPRAFAAAASIECGRASGAFFCKNRGVALLVTKGNPLGIHGLADVIRSGTRVALPDTGDVRAKCLAATEELLGKAAADALVAAESSFPGRLGIMHRDPAVTQT